MSQTTDFVDVPINPGLEGVIVADTELTRVDGQAGQLVLRGHPIEALASHKRFAEVAHLLWTGAFPGPEALADLDRRLGQAREMAFEHLDHSLSHRDGMDALRAGLSWLSAENGGGDPVSVCGAVATVAAAWVRTQVGQQPVHPDPARSHAEDVLRMATGTVDPVAATALDAYLVTVMDHGMNASTFTARVVTSTGSDLVSAVVAAIGALKGPLHGGAPGPVLDMLDEIGTRELAEPWLRAKLEAKQRIMGMGHRVYRVRDPRAAVLEVQARTLADHMTGKKNPGFDRDRIGLALHVEQTAQRLLGERYPERTLRANVEFYTALVLEAVGLPRTAFSPTFAVGRVAGWCAHVDEQRRTGRLIRPRARYVGPTVA